MLISYAHKSFVDCYMKKNFLISHSRFMTKSDYFCLPIQPMRIILLTIFTSTWLLSCEKPKLETPAVETPDLNTIVVLHDTTPPNGVNYNEIFTLSEDGTNAKRISRFGPQLRFPLAEPCWGPNGKIIFLSRHERPNYMIYSMNVDGSDVKRLTDGDDYHGNLDVSRTSGRILYTISGDIHSIKVDGTDETTFSTDFIQIATWHPDGQRIVYASEAFICGQRSNNIFIANYDGTDSQQLTHTNDRVYSYSYVSPDGKLLSYMIDNKIYVSNFDGTGEYVLSTQNEPVYRIKGWTGDSKQLLIQGDGSYLFYLLRIDGTGINRIGSTDKMFSSPSIK
jgi:Tol biopolymer transport system component